MRAPALLALIADGLPIDASTVVFDVELKAQLDATSRQP
jgi:hypothetical protein